MDSYVADTTVPTPDSSASDAPSGGPPTVDPAALSFGTAGLVNCGTQAASKTVTITNPTSLPFDWTAKLTSGATYYMVSPAMGTIAARSTQRVQVVPNPVPQASSVTTDLYGGTLSITTTAANDADHIVQLHMTAQGVSLTSMLGGQTLGLGAIAIGQTGSNQFSVSNNGNMATTVSFSVGSSVFSVTPSFSIGASQSVAPMVKFMPTAVQSYSDTIIVTVPGGTALCAPLPGNIAVTGTGTTGVSLAPTILNFGLVPCGQGAAAFQTTTISNTGPAMHFTPTLTAGGNSAYTLADATTGSPITPGLPIALGAGGSATLRVVPKTIQTPATTAADAYADTLTVTTDSAGDSPHMVFLHETAQGAIFTLNPSSISTSGPPSLTSFVPIHVTNSGNISATYTLTVTTTQGPSNTFSSTLPGGTVPGGGTQDGNLTCVAPPHATQAVGNIHLTPGVNAVLCADAPPDMPLSIVGN